MLSCLCNEYDPYSGDAFVYYDPSNYKFLCSLSMMAGYLNTCIFGVHSVGLMENAFYETKAFYSTAFHLGYRNGRMGVVQMPTFESEKDKAAYQEGYAEGDEYETEEEFRLGDSYKPHPHEIDLIAQWLLNAHPELWKS